MRAVKLPENLIEVKNISYRYDREPVLRQVTLAVPRGDYLGLVGPNGAGKTTLLRIMLGLLKPDQGSVRLFGQDIKQFKGWAKIGYVPQRIAAFEANFPATVSEVVLMGRYGRRGLFQAIAREDKQLANAALEEVGMTAFRQRLIPDLSGGELQRVFIARALASEPEIILLDEPTIGIDQRARAEFYALLKRFNRERRLTLVLVSHDVDMVVKEARHIACLDRALVCHSLPGEFLAHSESSKLFKERVKIIAHTHQH